MIFSDLEISHTSVDLLCQSALSYYEMYSVQIFPSSLFLYCSCNVNGGTYCRVK